MVREDIHSLIHCNFQQLHFLHPISFTFKEGMFKVPNVKGFQDSMHYLLSIVEPVKCAIMIPWPLLDKKGESQFRIAVKTLLMEINGAYPEANLPKIFPSFFMNPGGEKFAHFMWKLTKFVLFRSLCQTYGTSDVLFPPRTFSNDSLASAKLSLLQAMTESTTQKAIANQLKIDSLLSQECERQCSIQLNELEEGVKTYENLLKELIKDLAASTEMKEKLCWSCDDNNVIAEWVADVEAEGRVIEAIIHVLKKTGINVTNFLETIKLAENSNASQLCLDTNDFDIHTVSRNSMDNDLKEVMKEMQDGKLSVSEFIQSLIGLQASLIHHIDGKGLKNMSTVLPELHSVKSGFQEHEILFNAVETKLQETLNQVQKNYEALCKEFRTLKSKPTTEAEVSSSIISSVPAGTNAEHVYITDQTPVRGVNRNVCNKQTESEAAANIKLDPQLLQTPELERKLNTPLHMASISRTRKEYETPAHKSVYMLPATTSKKSRATDLRSLTSSLMKKKRTVEMRWQFQSVSRPYRSHEASSTSAVSKELFEASTEETGEKVCTSAITQTEFKQCTVNTAKDEFSHIPASSYENESSTLCLVDDCLDDINESDHVFAVSEYDVTSSPASLLCSPPLIEIEECTNRKENRRKSLDVFIQRYLKFRHNTEPT